MKNKLDNIRTVLATDMKRYVEVILKEYGNYIPEAKKEALNGIDDYSNQIKIQDTGTISMFADGLDVIMPKAAEKIFKYLKMIPGFGLNKEHKAYKDGEIVNENTYYDYIKHVFVSGMSLEEFFRDTLLHETMHVCGSDGGEAIREGLTELKTRELAEKYGLKASRSGYPKEVDIVSKFQEIVGKDIANQITFAGSNRDIHRILQEKCGPSVAMLYFEISHLMDEELSKKYDHSKFSGILGPLKKAKAYSSIDYSKVYEKIEDFERKRTVNNKSKNLLDKIRGSSEKDYEEKLIASSLEYEERKNVIDNNRANLDMDR